MIVCCGGVVEATSWSKMFHRAWHSLKTDALCCVAQLGQISSPHFNACVSFPIVILCLCSLCFHTEIICVVFIPFHSLTYCNFPFHLRVFLVRCNYILYSCHFSICNYSSPSIFSSHTFVIYFYTLRLMTIIVSLTIIVHATSCIRHWFLCRRWRYQNDVLFTQDHRTENNNDNLTCFITVYQDYIYIYKSKYHTKYNKCYFRKISRFNNLLRNKNMINAVSTCKA